jgi:Alginate lyase
MPRHERPFEGAAAVANGPLDPGAVTTRIPTPPVSTPPQSGWRRRFVGLVIAALVVAVGALLATGPLSSPTASPSSAIVASASQSESPPPSPTLSVPPSPSAIPSPSPSLPPPVGGYLATRDDLVARAALAVAGKAPYRAAVADLKAWARQAVVRRPNPATRLRIKGTEGPFVDDTATAYGLALTYVITGDKQYGEAAARFIMAWVDTTTSTRDTCRNDGSCQTSLIIGRTAPGFVFAADLLRDSGLLDSAAEGRFRTWLRKVILPTASELPNNWGDAGTFTRVAVTDYLGDKAGFAAALEKWRSLMDLVAADGHIPLEVARGSAGMGYTQEALDYKVAVAVIASRRGVDLWSYVGKDGGSLKRAVDYLARYMRNKSGWPWTNHVRRRPPSDMWELVYARWHDSDYRRLVNERRPYGVLGHSAVRWTTVTNGIPIGA